jgi:hypothetical protein
MKCKQIFSLPKCSRRGAASTRWESPRGTRRTFDHAKLYNASAAQESGDTQEAIDPSQPIVNRRRGFLKTLGLAGAALSAGALFSSRGPAKAASGVSQGDIAILRLLAAAELIEADLWQQYAELGGLTPGQLPVEADPSFKTDEQLSGDVHEPGSRRPAIYFQQCRRRAEPRLVPERVFAIGGRGSGGPRSFPHLKPIGARQFLTEQPGAIELASRRRTGLRARAAGRLAPGPTLASPKRAPPVQAMVRLARATLRAGVA